MSASVPDQALVASPSSPQAVSTKGFDPSRWLSASTAPRDREIIGLWGETIPDHFDVRAATFISPDEALELGYREFARFGGWLIWNDASDWFVLDENSLLGWLPLPTAIATEAGTAATAKQGAVHEGADPKGIAQ